MNILILQASPRAKGNTAWMAEEFKKAAEAAGHTVTLVNVGHKKIAGCLACEYCHGKGNGACIQKDDMQELYPLMAEAEALILAAPIYYFTLAAQLQAPIQRMYCVNKPAKVKKIGINDVFGESGPAAQLIKKYGLDGDSIYEAVKAFV